LSCLWNLEYGIGKKLLRLFLAIPIAPDILDALDEGIDTLREARAPVRWVRREGMHLTVKFLGDTESKKIASLAQALDTVCGEFEPFPISVAGIGAYPSMRRPRVVWAGVEEFSGTLLRLAGGVEDACAQLGWPREKREFSPHVTVGRVKGKINISRLAQAVGTMEDNLWGTQTVNSLVLYSSELKLGGAVYEKVHVSRLGKREPSRTAD
jgi:2'-5' RNA ligase